MPKTDINKRDHNGYTPLLRLVMRRNVHTYEVQELINNGADPSLTGNKNNEWYGYNALHIAAYNCRPDLIIEICKYRNLELLIRALDATIDRTGVTRGEYPGCTPLLLALTRGSEKKNRQFSAVAVALVEAGADPSISRCTLLSFKMEKLFVVTDQYNLYGYNALHIAVLSNWDEVVRKICERTDPSKLQLAKAAKVDRQNATQGYYPNYTPLDIATENGNQEIKDILNPPCVPIASPAIQADKILDHSASIQIIQCYNDLSPGDVLIKYNDGSPVNEIIQVANGMNKGAYGGRFNTQLTHVAIYLGHAQIVEASDEGLELNYIDINQYHWEIFRYNLPDVVEFAKDIAATIAIESIERRKMHELRSGSYDYIGAIRAAFANNYQCNVGQLCDQFVQQAKSLDLSNEKFYCSQFIAFVYNLAATIIASSQITPEKIVLPIETGQVGILPARLSEYCRENHGWKHIGNLVPASVRCLYPLRNQILEPPSDKDNSCSTSTSQPPLASQEVKSFGKHGLNDYTENRPTHRSFRQQPSCTIAPALWGKPLLTDLEIEHKEKSRELDVDKLVLKPQ